MVQVLTVFELTNDVLLENLKACLIRSKSYHGNDVDNAIMNEVLCELWFGALIKRLVKKRRKRS